MSKRKKRISAQRVETSPSQPVRTVALVGHRGAGKTTLAEAMLVAGGALRGAGAVDLGTTLLDHDPLERRRHRTLFNGYGWMEWRDSMVQLIDTPGTEARAGERRHAIQASDVVVVVVDAGHTLPVGGERAILEAERAGLPCFIFVNKLDRPHELGGLIDTLKVGERAAVCIEVPISDGGSCGGAVDLLTGVSLPLNNDFRAPPKRFFNPFVSRLHEEVALTDDALIAHFLEHNELPGEMLEAALGVAIRQGRLNPVVFGSAQRAFGIERLLDHIVTRTDAADQRRGPRAMEFDGTPIRVHADGDFVAQMVSAHLDEDGSIGRVFRVFRGTAPLNQPWVHAESGATTKVRKLYRQRGSRRAAARYRGPGALLATWDPLPGRPGDTFTSGERLVVSRMDPPSRMMTWAFPWTDTLEEALQTLVALDGTLEFRRSRETGQAELSGVSEAHLQLMLDLASERLGIDVEPGLPRVPYRETPVGLAKNVLGEHRVEDGDGLAVEFGSCIVDLGKADGESLDFRDAFSDLEELPERFRTPIADGVERGCAHGPLGGYPVMGVEVVLRGGRYDMLQSKEEHFRQAGEHAVRAALATAGTRLLEPWWKVDVYVPSTSIGEAITEVSGRRGRVMGMDVLGAETRVVVSMPYRELRTFGGGLEGVTGGRGRFFGDFSHFEPAPANLVREAIDASPFGNRR